MKQEVKTNGKGHMFWSHFIREKVDSEYTHIALHYTHQNHCLQKAINT